jgi:hypothetical protein
MVARLAAAGHHIPALIRDAGTPPSGAMSSNWARRRGTTWSMSSMRRPAEDVNNALVADHIGLLAESVPPGERKGST